MVQLMAENTCRAAPLVTAGACLAAAALRLRFLRVGWARPKVRDKSAASTRVLLLVTLLEILAWVEIEILILARVAHICRIELHLGSYPIVFPQYSSTTLYQVSYHTQSQFF